MRWVTGLSCAAAVVLHTAARLPASAQSVEAQPNTADPNMVNNAAEALDIDPSVVESSPVLQRWLEETPDLREDIRRDPAFRPRLRLGYVRVTDGENKGGILAGVEDILLTRSGLTLSADYRGTLDGDRHSAGGELRYYLLPLGRRVNIAPVVGYRGIKTSRDAVDGVAVGVRLLLVPSRTGAADLAVAQTLVNPGGGEEASRFTVSAGYALTQQLRIGGDIQIETVGESETQAAVVLEWLL
ncbi:MAG: hypothetical protein ACFB4J_19430 [Elainellaceae cyanobacterium]